MFLGLTLALNDADMLVVTGYTLQEKIRDNRNIDTYHALRRKDKRKVLVKIPSTQHASPDNLAILQHEFQLLKQLNTPTIIKAYDFLHHTAVPILILEGVEGDILKNYLAKHQLGISEFLNLALQLVEIIGELHQLKIIHKEIRPSNIIINRQQSTLKLIDLSASTKLTEEAFDYLSLKNFEESLLYISPEQTNRINRPVDYRTDFYSLGVTLYQMLTNRLPFETTDPLELVHSHIAKMPENIHHHRGDAPQMIVAIIEKLLQKMPEERYTSVIGLRADLQRCQNEWSAKGRIDDFKLGLHDSKDHLNISRNLYGRKKQVKQLLDIFFRVSAGSKEIVFIAGYSGIGKTSLVAEVQKPIVQHKGYYIQGKFDQLHQSIPYSAIVTAFKNLVQQVLAESESRLQELKEQLISVLGNVGQVVIDVIPEIELIIGKQPPVSELSPADAQIRFNLVFQNFVRVFAQKAHPLIIFLDDLQWADQSSLNFIENLMNDSETNYLLIIGAYRDNEVSAYHPLQRTINNLNKNIIKSTSLTLQPLQLKNIQHLLEDTLAVNLEKNCELAQCIFNKTQGNPFFVNEFIKSLYQQKILRFSYQQGLWHWDLKQIKLQSSTENVIDFLTTKINTLPSSTQELLKLAACFGHQFAFKTLLTISGNTVNDTAKGLAQAIRSNLIYPLEASYKTMGLVGLDEFVTDFKHCNLNYRFHHDRIQQASYELIAPEARPELHLRIGRLLLKEKVVHEHDEDLFEIMKHFNQGLALIHDPKEKLQLAEYNLWAGLRAKHESAYYTADSYLSKALTLLSPADWQNNYLLTFQLYKEAAACKYLIAEFSAAEHYVNELLQHGQNDIDKLGIYRLKIEMLSTLNKHTEALELGISTLKILGVNIPARPTLIHILSAVYRIKLRTRKTKIAESILPPLQDLKQTAILNLITQLLNSAFITNQQVFVLLVCIHIRLSLEFGYTESTSMCLLVYAFVLMHSFYLYDEALAFVAFYNKLKQRYGASDFEGKNQFIIGSFIQPYQVSFAEATSTCLKAFKLCCESGDLVYGNYSSILQILHELSAGKNLEAVKKSVHSALSFMSRVKISDFITIVQFWDYSLHCLEDPHAAQITQADSFEQKIIAEKSKTQLSFFYSTTTRLHFLLGNPIAAIHCGAQHEKYADYDRGLIPHFDGNFFYALAIAQHFAQFSKSEQRFYRKKFKKLSAFIAKYASWSSVNFKAHSLLLAAEMACMNQDHQHILPYYQQAIETAKAQELILIAALANEAAARYCLATGLAPMAKVYLDDAYQQFKEWGMNSKLKFLQDTYPGMVGTNDGDLIKAPPLAGASPNLDMLSILKLNHLISSEIRIDKLLQNFMAIVLENGGAQRGVILAKVNNRWVIEVEGNVQEPIIHLNNFSDDEESLKYPASILNYVQRTEKTIIINEAMHSELAFKDPYIQKERPRSLLMIPLFYQGHMSRILYLEDKNSHNTFTPKSIDTLQLLCSQAMTSLENAKLYYQATHDPLTGLANRNMLYELFEQATKKSDPTANQVALLFLDLDFFKVTNDTLGHEYGDKLLIQIADILTSFLREGDVASRIGGDEFVIMFTNISSAKQIKHFVEWLFKEIAKPFRIGGHLIQTTASMGISIYPHDGRDIQTLLKVADIALYEAKGKGRNQYSFYSTQLFEEYQLTHGLDKQLQSAFDNQEFFLMYQPLYEIHTGKIIGFETLLRWHHPERGILEARDFIGTLEKSTLIIPVSEWILKTACKQVKTWQEKKLFSGALAINISVHFLRHSLTDFLTQVLDEIQLAPASIELEILESVFIDYSENLDKEIMGLHQLGVNFVIDDFGTGYSSLSYLKRLPLKKIKIDKLFIEHCEQDFLDQAIISAITTMAHKVNVEVIAEGIENEQQLKMLKTLGVDGVQGYFYSVPLTADACEIYLVNHLKK